MSVELVSKVTLSETARAGIARLVEPVSPATAGALLILCPRPGSLLEVGLGRIYSVRTRLRRPRPPDAGLTAPALSELIDESAAADGAGRRRPGLGRHECHEVGGRRGAAAAGHPARIAFVETEQDFLRTIDAGGFDIVWSALYYITPNEKFIGRGEGGMWVADVLDRRGIPYVGSNSQTMKDMIDKFKTHETLATPGRAPCRPTTSCAAPTTCR